MIIECPSCQARYRIREEKLPADGGGIKCPNCAHVFVVTPGGQVAEPPKPVPAHGTQYNRAVKAAEEEIEQARAALEAAEAPVPPPADAPAKKVVERWKVRNAGLVFDFADIDSVKRWLANRESLEGVEVSDDLGQSWAPVSAFEDLSDLRNARKPAITLPGGGRDTAPDANRGRTIPPGSAAPPTPDDIRAEAEARLREARSARGMTDAPAVVPTKRDEKREPAKEEKAKKFERVTPIAEERQARIASGSKVLAGISLVVLPLLLAVGLHATGTADLSGILPFLPARTDSSQKVQLDNGVVVNRTAGESAPRAVSPTAQPTTPPASKPAPPSKPAAEGTSIVIYQARAAVSRGDAQEAIKLLEQANQLTRDDRQVLCLLAGLYGETGNRLSANSFASKCKAVGGSPERISLPAQQPAAPEAAPPPAEGAAPALEPAPDQGPAPTVRRRVRTAAGDGP